MVYSRSAVKRLNQQDVHNEGGETQSIVWWSGTQGLKFKSWLVSGVKDFTS